MDETAPGILEIRLVLLGTVAAGWAASRIGLPAVVRYLALGLAVSPFRHKCHGALRRLLQESRVRFEQVAILWPPADGPG
jgi:Kef-type K+ transport system membrane component KefB